MSKEVEYLTDELRRLVPYGASTHRVALLPTLRKLVSPDESLTRLQSGSLIRTHLKRSVLAISEPQEFAGKLIEPAILKRCFNLLFEFEGVGYDVIERRCRVIQLLEVGHLYSEQTWRKGVEREFLHLLAETLLPPDHQIAANF